MGNTTSTSLKVRVARDNSPSRQYVGTPRLPQSVDLFLPTEDARELQIDLGNLAATSRYLLNVANEHRFHSFILPLKIGLQNPSLLGFLRQANINTALSLQTAAIPELIERLIQYTQLGRELRYLSIRDFTLTYKAGITKRRLQLFIRASLCHGVPIPPFVPELLQGPTTTMERLDFETDNTFWVEGELWLSTTRSRGFDAWLIRLIFGLASRLEKLRIDPVLAEEVFMGQFSPAFTLPSVASLFVPRIATNLPEVRALAPRFRTEALLPSFPNLRHFQNHDPSLIAFPVDQNAKLPPPLFPTVRKLTLAASQAERLQHVTEILCEFSGLQELVYHRSPAHTSLGSGGGLDFSNANLFDGVHHCLRKLTYSSTMVRSSWGKNSAGSYYWISITSYAQRRFSDVPHFGGFQVLEHLTIDQALLGRLSPVTEYHEPQIGPKFPELSWDLPQSLRTLYVRYVYDTNQLVDQLMSVARAKAKEGRFRHLSDIYITRVENGTHVYAEEWVPQIPLLPTNDVLKLAGKVMMEAGVCLWSVGAKIGPPPGEADQYRHRAIEAGVPIRFYVKRDFFHGL